MTLAQIPKSEPNAHDKKRRGHHHKATKHYAKTYWPYLPMLLIVILGFVVNIFLSSAGQVLSYATSVDTSSLLQETNIQRTQNGREALALNGYLNQAAQAKANDMASRDYWSHATPEGTQPWQFISSTGYTFTYAGENLAYGFDTSAATLAGWMNSSGHRANVLKAEYTEIGFGIANAANYQQGGEQTIVVAMYATPKKIPVAAPAPVKTQTTTPTPAPEATQVKPAEQDPATTPSEPTPAPAATPTPSEKPVTELSQPAFSTPTKTLAPQAVSRIDVLTNGNASWAVMTITTLITIGAISLVYRHGKVWRKYLIRGEHFILRHPVFDIVTVALIVTSIVLSQTTGFIH